MRNQDPRFLSNSNSQSTDISRLVQQVLKTLHPEIEMQDVSLETDLSELVATVQPDTIIGAVQKLVRHALTALPEGGEISVTLIDGNYQWELEVADSSSGEDWHAVHRSDQALPTIVADQWEANLADAHRLAMSHGGQIQTWKCPQGGVANVLVVPKYDQFQTGSLRRAA